MKSAWWYSQHSGSVSPVTSLRWSRCAELVVEPLLADLRRATADEAGLEDQVVGEPAGLHHRRAREPDLAGGPGVVGVDAAHSKHQTLDEVGTRPSAGVAGVEAEAPRRAPVSHDLMRQRDQLVPRGRDLVPRLAELGLGVEHEALQADRQRNRRELGASAGERRRRRPRRSDARAGTRRSRIAASRGRRTG